MHCFGVSSCSDDFCAGARLDFLFNLRLNFLLCFSHFMCEFISFDGKRNEPKKSRPYRVGLRLLCALQLRPVAAELAALRQSSLFSGLSLQCSTTQKGIGRSKPVLLRHTGVGRYPVFLKKDGFRLKSCRNDGNRKVLGVDVDLQVPFRLAEKHRMSRSLRGAPV